jgi:glucosylceramidase
MFMAVGPASIDPGKSYKLAPKSAPTKAIDIANGSQSNGTAVQQYDGYGGDPQKLVLKDSGKGNVKLTMKLNNNKCVGPKGGTPAHGVKLEVQDCNGGNAQAWITGETSAGSGVFMLKNVAAPGLCVDVTGASSANGAAMQVANCTGQGNQLFGATLSP